MQEGLVATRFAYVGDEGRRVVVEYVVCPAAFDEVEVVGRTGRYHLQIGTVVKWVVCKLVFSN